MCLVCCILLLYDCPDGGSLFVCGLNKDGQLGLGHTEDVLCFTICKPLLGCPIRQVACGWDFTIMLTAPEREGCVAAGLRHALATTVSGSVFQWGTGLASSGDACVANSSIVFDSQGTKQSDGPRGFYSNTGELYVWGRNKHGQLASLAAFLLLPQRIDASCFQDEKVIAVWSGWTHLVAQTVDLPLIDSLIRVLQNMEHCQKKLANSTEAPTNCVSTQDDFHMKILKDISCEFLSNIFQALTKFQRLVHYHEGDMAAGRHGAGEIAESYILSCRKRETLGLETMAKGLKEGQLSKKKYSCAFQSLLPLYSPVVEDFIKVLHEVDKAVAEDLEESFPSVKAQLKTQV